MRWLGPICAALLVAGCASRAKVAPPPFVGPEIAAEEGGCVACPEADPETPEPLVEIAPPAAVPDMEVECRQAAGFVDAGEHKLAVESLDKVLKAGASCDDLILGAVQESQRLLAEADELARRGLDARRAGDVARARQSFRQALALYPKYYWVKKLEQDLPADFSRELGTLREAASAAEASGRYTEAIDLLEEAARLPSAGPELAEEIGRLRADLVVTRLGAARHAQRTGNLGQALTWTERALAARPDPPLRAEVIEFARRLGLTLFSAGELVQARELWSGALALDEANAQLLQYLDEVEARLRSLDAIKDDEE